MKPGDTNPARLRWQGEDLAVTPCDLAAATAAPEGISIAFGRREPAETAQAPGAVRGRLLHQVQLQPDAAAGLLQMLRRLLEAHDAHAGARQTPDVAAELPSSSEGGAPASANPTHPTQR